MAYTTINKGSSYFNPVLYTGNGATQSITGVGFQPDFVWIKDRTNAYGHDLYDVIRTATYRIQSNDASAESTASGLTSFNSDGFTLGSYIGNNTNTANYVSWNWLANGAGVSNTQGSITSTVSANTTAGFSIVSWTGNGSSSATVGHGLGVAPKMIILKRRNASDTWYVMHTSLTSNNNVFLNLTDAQQNVSTYTAGLISTSPTSSVFSFVNGSTVNNVNASGGTYIAYCFADVKGFSKFGSYTGNGNADGTFVYTGFKPAFVLLKSSSNSGWNWRLSDNKRDNFNSANNKNLFPSSSDAEVTSEKDVDFLSNGFKLRTNDNGVNTSGWTIIYMAFAENPFVSSTQIPTTAR